MLLRVLTRIHGCSGHLVRLPATGPQARALKFRNKAWWAHTQALGNSSDPLNKSGWRHSRPGRFSRWEHQLTRVLHSWAQRALDRSSWRLTLYTFLGTSLDLLGARNCTKELSALLRRPLTLMSLCLNPCRLPLALALSLLVLDRMCLFGALLSANLATESIWCALGITLRLSTACWASGPALNHHTVAFVMLLDALLRSFLLLFVSLGTNLYLASLGGQMSGV